MGSGIFRVGLAGVVWGAVGMLAVLAAAPDSFAQTKKQAKPPGTPELRLRPAAELFFDAFEHYKAGRLADAEQLFMAGLQQNGRDVKAWEMLARVQAALGKAAEAEASLAEAAKLGLPEGKVAEIREGLSFARPTALPPAIEACLSSEARAELVKIPVPRAGRTFYQTTELCPGSFNGEKTTIRFFPVMGGFDFERRSDAGPDAAAGHTAAVLGGLVVCTIIQDQNLKITSLRLTGNPFLDRSGNRFVLETRRSYKNYATVQSCVAEEVIQASELGDTRFPNAGTLTFYSCEERISLDVSLPQKYDRVYSSHLGAFIPGRWPKRQPNCSVCSPGCPWQAKFSVSESPPN